MPRGRLQTARRILRRRGRGASLGLFRSDWRHASRCAPGGADTLCAGRVGVPDGAQVGYGAGAARALRRLTRGARRTALSPDCGTPIRRRAEGGGGRDGRARSAASPRRRAWEAPPYCWGGGPRCSLIFADLCRCNINHDLRPRSDGDGPAAQRGHRAAVTADVVIGISCCCSSAAGLASVVGARGHVAWRKAGNETLVSGKTGKGCTYRGRVGR